MSKHKLFSYYQQIPLLNINKLSGRAKWDGNVDIGDTRDIGVIDSDTEYRQY